MVRQRKTFDAQREFFDMSKGFAELWLEIASMWGMLTRILDSQAKLVEIVEELANREVKEGK